MLYALIVALLSLAGAAVPLRYRLGHAQLQVYLSLAAGALLGAALFHLLPEASEQIHDSFGLPAALGIGLVFFLQRYLAPHSHEPLGHHGHAHDQSRDRRGDQGGSVVSGAPLHGAQGQGAVLAADAYRHPTHVASAPCSDVDPHHHKHGPPLVTGLVAILALSIHSFFDGVAIGAAGGDFIAGGSLGVAVFLSVLIHKPLDGLSVSVLLLNSGIPRGRLWTIQLLYAALVPVGAVAFSATRGAIAEPSAFVGYTLAFSAGTFLAIALTDLLPELHFHAHDRHKLSAALLTGLLVMWLTSQIGHPTGSESHEGHEHATRQSWPVSAVVQPAAG
jgi:zinc and cadmium transporter